MKHCAQWQFNREHGVYTAQYREYIKMVKEIGEKTNNNTNWCEWKIIAPKSEQIFRKLHGWTRESNFARPHASTCSLVLSHFPFVAPLHFSLKYQRLILHGITFVYQGLLFSLFFRRSVSCSSIPLYLCNSNCFFSEIIQHQIHGFHNCRFPQQSVCAHFSL